MPSWIETLRPDVDWHDSDRVNVLFAPFRPRDLNPGSYDAKMTFWKETIAKSLEERKTFKLSLVELSRGFQFNSRRPAGLAAVLADMRDNDKSIVDGKEFVTSFKESWANIPWRILKAGTSLIYSALSPKSKEAKEAAEYFHLEMLKKRGVSLLEAIEDIGDKYCKKEDIDDCDQDVDTLLEYLKYHENLIDFRDIDHEVFIKPKAGKNPFNDTDVAVIRLDITINKLETSAEEIDHKILEKKVELKNSIAKGESKVRMKSLLRQIKRMALAVERQTKTIDNLRQVLASIEAAEENAKIISTLLVAKKALHGELEGQEVDKVEDLVNDVRELVDKTEDVAEVMRYANDANNEGVLSDEELESELMNMLKEENDKTLEKALADLKIVDRALPVDSPPKAPSREAETAL